VFYLKLDNHIILNIIKCDNSLSLVEILLLYQIKPRMICAHYYYRYSVFLNFERYKNILTNLQLIN